MNFSLKRCLAVARVESLQLLADRAALFLIFVLPIFQILLYGYGITLDPERPVEFRGWEFRAPQHLHARFTPR